MLSTIQHIVATCVVFVQQFKIWWLNGCLLTCFHVRLAASNGANVWGCLFIYTNLLLAAIIQSKWDTFTNMGNRCILTFYLGNERLTHLVVFLNDIYAETQQRAAINSLCRTFKLVQYYRCLWRLVWLLMILSSFIFFCNTSFYLLLNWLLW